ncbi:unnamed protein product [Acidithrix sp. C25]|nr:unnamed protein product [Acidithrix sp. C25]
MSSGCAPMAIVIAGLFITVSISGLFRRYVDVKVFSLSEF